MELVKKVIFPRKNRFTYSVFFLLAFPLNLSEGGVPWYNWIINPFLLGWGAVGLKLLLENALGFDSVTKFLFWRRVLVALVILFVISRFIFRG